MFDLFFDLGQDRKYYIMVIKIRILVITTNKNHPKADTNVSVRGATLEHPIRRACAPTLATRHAKSARYSTLKRPQNGNEHAL